LFQISKDPKNDVPAFKACPLLNETFCPAVTDNLIKGKTVPVVVYNPTSWPRAEWLDIPVAGQVQGTTQITHIILVTNARNTQSSISQVIQSLSNLIATSTTPLLLHSRRKSQLSDSARTLLLLLRTAGLRPKLKSQGLLEVPDNLNAFSKKTLPNDCSIRYRLGEQQHQGRF
jgi:hypothetical protein